MPRLECEASWVPLQLFLSLTFSASSTDLASRSLVWEGSSCCLCRSGCHKFACCVYTKRLLVKMFDSTPNALFCQQNHMFTVPWFMSTQGHIATRSPPLYRLKWFKVRVLVPELPFPLKTGALYQLNNILVIITWQTYLYFYVCCIFNTSRWCLYITYVYIYYNVFIWFHRFLFIMSIIVPGTCPSILSEKDTTTLRGVAVLILCQSKLKIFEDKNPQLSRWLTAASRPSSQKQEALLVAGWWESQLPGIS